MSSCFSFLILFLFLEDHSYNMYPYASFFSVWRCNIANGSGDQQHSSLRRCQVGLLNLKDPEVYAKEMKLVSWRDICTTVLIATLFTIAKIWKAHKCLSMDEWIKKMWLSVYLSIDIYLLISIYLYLSISIMEYYSAIKKKEILPFVTTWMDQEGITYYVKWNKPDRGRHTICRV